MGMIFNVFTNFMTHELYSGASVKIRVSTVVFAIVIFIITYVVLKVIKKGIVKFFPVDDMGRLDTAFNFVNYFIYGIVFFSVLNAIGININMFLTATAALFVGLGFALQQIFQDLIAGIYILLDKTLHVGDVIRIDGEVARVNVINLRSTIAETRDRRILVIPNRIFINDIIHNWTQDHEVIRAKIEVGVFIGTDVQLVKEALLKSVENNPEVLKDPFPIVMIDDFGESSIRFHLKYFVVNAFDNDRIASDIRFDIDKQFREHGIRLPVPVLKLEQYQ